MEDNGGGETGNLVAILCEDVRKNGVAARWDLTRQLNVLCQLQLSLLQGALQIDLLDLFAEIRFLIDKGDEAIFDLEVYFRAFFDVGGQVAFGGYGEGLASFWRVGIQINILNNQEVVTRVRAEVQRVLSGNLEVQSGSKQILVLTVAAEPCGPCRHGGDVDESENGRELHARGGDGVRMKL